MSKKARSEEARILRAIASLHRELAEAYERLAGAMAGETPAPKRRRRINVDPPAIQPSEATTRKVRNRMRELGMLVDS